MLEGVCYSRGLIARHMRGTNGATFNKDASGIFSSDFPLLLLCLTCYCAGDHP